MKYIDNFLNSITMYRLVLYYVIGLLLVAIVLSAIHILPYNPILIIFSSLFLYFFSGFINDIFAKVFTTPPNVESTYITALILALLITPAVSIGDYVFLGWAAVLSIASKYILAINKKHLFNPVAVAVVLTSFGIGQSASWWVGNLPMLPFVFIGGLLIVRKIKREKMVLSFFAASAISIIFFSLFRSSNIFSVFDKVMYHTAYFFFAFVMLTEPLTTPPTAVLQMFYGALVGLLYAPDVHLGFIYSTPELALIAGNIFSYLVSPKYKLLLFLKEKLQLTQDTFDFVFPLKQKLSFIPGQYLEWTLPVTKGDSRGNRRYFTIASSPTEDTLRIGVKFYSPASQFKQEMLRLTDKTPIVATQLAGDFTLPQNTSKKLVFLAGGIGVTPFRSMLKYLLDKKERRDIVVFYSNKYANEIVYTDVFTEAAQKLGIKVVYTITDRESAPKDWMYEKGRVDESMLKKYVPDYMERTFFLSGPHMMVTSFTTLLGVLHVPKNHIKTDFFPGFA
jgi:glycine betaine catabolism B